MFALAPQDRPKGLGDLAGRQRAGGHLVQQRLEQVVVPVDERHVTGTVLPSARAA